MMEEMYEESNEIVASFLPMPSEEMIKEKPPMMTDTFQEEEMIEEEPPMMTESFPQEEMIQEKPAMMTESFPQEEEMIEEEMIEEEPDDWFYFPILNREDERHRFLDSQADFIFYFMKHTSKLYSAEPSALRARIIELWQKEGAKYKNAALIELSNGFKYVAFPKEECEDLFTEHSMTPAVLHLLKNYGSLTNLDAVPYNRSNTERETQ